jgi:cellulose synthase (UDP-forming)
VPAARVIRPCAEDPFYRYFPKNCELAPAIPAVRHRAVHHQTWSQALTDAVWHSPVFRLAGVAVLLALIPVLTALVLAYVRQRRGRPLLMVAQPPGALDRAKYFTVQGRRALTVLFAVTSAGSVYGIWEVFSKSWVWRPWLAVLLVLVPWILFTTAVALRRPTVTPETHAAQLDGASRTASIDVFIATAGEDLGVLANTFASVARLRWDGPVHAYVLDDSRHGDAMRKLAAFYGIFYLYRPVRGEYKKAGNLNYAVSQTASEFIVVFDADFVPASGFLEDVIPYFAAPDAGIVQTSQYFSTGRRDTANWMARLAGTVQQMFFCWSQPGNNSMAAAFCVGTNVAYRRTALEAAGGFPKISGGEDLITSVEFLAAGFSTVYVPLNLARGLCPEDFPAVVRQQYRWALTTFAMALPIRGIERVCDGFWHCPMSLRKRFMFLAGFLYYAQSLLVLVTAVMPSLIMLWEYPFEVGPGTFLPLLPSMLGLALLPLMIPGWRLEMMRLSLVYAVAHLLAVIDAVTGRVAPWVPSGVSVSGLGTGTAFQAAVIVRSWVVVTQGLAWWALARDVPRFGLPAYWIPILLASIQTVIFFPLLLPGYGTVPLFRRYAARHLHRGAVS